MHCSNIIFVFISSNINIWKYTITMIMFIINFKNYIVQWRFIGAWDVQRPSLLVQPASRQSNTPTADWSVQGGE